VSSQCCTSQIDRADKHATDFTIATLSCMLRIPLCAAG
jgi:hypothetical protein